MKKFVLGVDVGGTNIKFGLVNPSGKVIVRNSLVTKTFIRDQKKLIQAMVDALVDLMAREHLPVRRIAGIGVGLPGIVDTKQGMVRFLPNIPGWRDVPLEKILRKKLDVPVFIENDVNMITLGEWRFGAGRGIKNLVCVTLGTGVGGGLIMDNKLYHGEGFAAGEIGHIPINEKGPHCSCGGFGCLESYVGNKHLVKRAGEIMNKQEMALEEMFRLANAGNRKALKFWEETATHIGNGLVGVVNLLNPQRIVIGGGVANNHKFLFKTIQDIIRKRAMPTQAAMVEILRAKLGNDAGIIGAQVLVNHGIQ